ncbi:MAG: helix-turn-helix transcriptional regulator [Firmicutes bacterium]|nr:helix-turn-helix transcriptional regulator [Bacillota bacterium]
MKQYINRRTVGMFLVVFLCLALLSGTIVTMSYMNSMEQERLDYLELLQNETGEVFDHLEQPLSEGVVDGYSVFSSTWYKHYQNIAGIYNNEFNAIKRSDIHQELSRIAGTRKLIEDFVLVMPEKQQVIVSRSGWFTPEMYKLVYDTIGIDSSAGLTVTPVITVNDPNYCALVLPDSTVRKYKNVLVLLINKDTFTRETKRYLHENAVWVKAELDGQVLVDPGCEAPSDCILMSRSGSASKFTLTIGYKTYEQAMAGGARALYMLLMGTAAVVSLLFALLITMMFLRPMNRMIRQLGGKEQDLEDPYRFIYEYVGSFSSRSEQLNEENAELLSSRSRLLSMLRNEIVLKILTGENTDFGADYIHSSFPWLSQKGYFLLAACRNSFSGQRSEKLTASDLCAECDNSCFAHIGQELWMLLRFESEEKLLSGRKELQEKMRKMPNLISAAFEDPAEAHGIYLEMGQALKELSEQWLRLPVLTQSRLVSLARTNKREELCQVIAEISENYNLESVFWLLTRLSWECGQDDMAIAQRYHIVQDTGTREDLVKLLQDYAVSLCTHLSAGRPVRANDNSEEIIRYIDENFRDAMLSVNQLADQFGIHRTLISKMVKSATGETFSDYVTNLRMAEAEKLLREGVRPIAVVGEKVGIPNYSTFKRSFQKAFGESPKEWLENQ